MCEGAVDIGRVSRLRTLANMWCFKLHAPAVATRATLFSLRGALLTGRQRCSRECSGKLQIGFRIAVVNIVP